MNENGFTVNTEVKVKNRKKRKKALIKRAVVLSAFAAVLLLIGAIILCATLPIRSVKVLDYSVAERRFGDTADSVDTTTTYYDQNGKIIKKVEATNGSENGYITYTYDKKGNLTKTESTYMGMLTMSQRYVYEGGKLVKVEDLDINNVVTNHIEYHYNQDGTVTMEIVYDGEGNAIHQCNHTYEKGVKIESIDVTLQDNSTEITKYSYKNGNLVKEEKTSDRVNKTVEYTYDNSGNMLTKTTFNSLTGKKYSEYIVYKYTYKTVKVPLI